MVSYSHMMPYSHMTLYNSEHLMLTHNIVFTCLYIIIVNITSKESDIKKVTFSILLM